MMTGEVTLRQQEIWGLTPNLTGRDFPGHASTLPFSVRAQEVGVGVGVVEGASQ